MRAQIIHVESKFPFVVEPLELPYEPLEVVLVDWSVVDENVLCTFLFGNSGDNLVVPSRIHVALVNSQVSVTVAVGLGEHSFFCEKNLIQVDELALLLLGLADLV